MRSSLTIDQSPISPLFLNAQRNEVASRLNEHVNEHNLSEVFQSAYKKGHSTESALFRVHNIFYEQLTMVTV